MMVKMMSLKKRSLISGILYLALIIPGPFAYILIPEMLLEHTDVTSYVTNNMHMIYIWLLLDMIIIGIEVVLTYYLLKIFNQFNKKLSFTAFIFRAIMTLVMVLNSMYLLSIIFNGGTNVIDMINLHNQGIFIWQSFFSIHVLLLGYMLVKYKQNYIKYLGYILFLGGIGYLVDVTNYFFATPSFLQTIGSILLVFVTLAEILTGIALLLNKINQHK